MFTGCCNDEIINSHTLNSVEKSLIPYKSFQEFDFINEEGNTYIATSQPQESKVEVRYTNPHSCDQEDFETITSALKFESKDLYIDIKLEADFIANLILLLNGNEFAPLILNCELSKQLNEYFQDITVRGFEFQNV